MRRFALLLLVAVIACACGVDSTARSGYSSAASSSPPPTADYINIGDSFSSGAGLGHLVEDSNTFCQRSTENFAHIVARKRSLVLDDVSCSGAKTVDLTNPQYLGVPPQFDAFAGARPKLVTVMIGGNDGGLFSDIIEVCGEAARADSAGSLCTQQHGVQLVDMIRTDTFPALRVALREIKERAHGTRVMVIGYPYLVPREKGCYPYVRIASGDVPMIRQLERTLNDAVRRAADESGVTFIDMAELSNGRDACAPAGVRWIEPQFGSKTAATMHPNELGQEAFAEQVLRAL